MMEEVDEGEEYMAEVVVDDEAVGVEEVVVMLDEAEVNVAEVVTGDEGRRRRQRKDSGRGGCGACGDGG